MLISCFTRFDLACPFWPSFTIRSCDPLCQPSHCCIQLLSLLNVRFTFIVKICSPEVKPFFSLLVCLWIWSLHWLWLLLGFSAVAHVCRVKCVEEEVGSSMVLSLRHTFRLPPSPLLLSGKRLDHDGPFFSLFFFLRSLNVGGPWSLCQARCAETSLPPDLDKWCWHDLAQRLLWRQVFGESIRFEALKNALALAKWNWKTYPLSLSAILSVLLIPTASPILDLTTTMTINTTVLAFPVQNGMLFN